MFSIIITVYNAEKIINKTINMIIKNCSNQLFEIIIVNDGSNDGTSKILNKFKNVNNITIINQENFGVSRARNIGIKNVNKDSEYITFVDDSDMISDNFIGEAKSIFEKYKNINLAMSPMLITKGNSSYDQSLNYRFNNNVEYVDILKNYNYIQYHIGGVVFKTDLFRNNNYEFNESLSYWEDAALINSIVLDQRYYGLIKNSMYYYDRNNKNSLSQIAWYSSSRYAYHIKENYLPLLNKSQTKYGEVIDYIQYLLALHYLEYLLEHNQKFIDKMKSNLSGEFKEYSKKLFKYIEFDIINKLNCSTRYKAFLYELKGKEYPYHLIHKKVRLLIHSYKKKKLLFSFSDDIGIFNNKVKISIYFGNKKISSAETKSDRKVTIFGNNVNDISLFIFETYIPKMLIIFGFKVKVMDLDSQNIIWIKSDSMFKRIIRRFYKKGE